MICVSFPEAKPVSKPVAPQRSLAAPGSSEKVPASGQALALATGIVGALAGDAGKVHSPDGAEVSVTALQQRATPQRGRIVTGSGCTIADVENCRVLARRGLTFQCLLYLGAGKLKQSFSDKGKGKFKGKGKSGGKGGNVQDVGAVVPLWFGDAEGDVICLVAGAAQLQSHAEQLASGRALTLASVDVHERFSKTLKWVSTTSLSVDVMAPDGLRSFPYEKFTEYAQHYASKSFIDSDMCPVNTIVSLPVMVVDIEDGWSKTGEQYAKVTAVDGDRATIGPLYLWDFPPSDFEIDGVYMFRGLKVSWGRLMNDQTGLWTRNPNAGKVLECNPLTAIEAVSNETVRSYFL